MRSVKLLAGVAAGSLLAALTVSSPAYAAIGGQSATNTATTVTYQFTYTGAPQYARTNIDTDRSAATGFAQNGVGADYLLENGSLYRHNGGGWSWTRRLGYRFTLQTGTYPSTATRGGSLPVTITLRNDGFATPYNARGVEFVLRNTSTGAVQRLPLTTDPRRWSAGTTTTISQTLTVPAGVPAGTYALLLNLPDPQLSGRPEYSVRFANQSTWESATGMNSLLRTITIS